MSNPNTNNQANIEYTKNLKLPKPPAATFGAQHPFNNTANHELLLQYIQSRLMLSRELRDAGIKRIVNIDKKIAGWMRLSDEDQARQRAQESTGTPVATAINLPLTYIHLDDMMTYFAQTFAPNRGMFYQTGKPEEQKDSKQIVTLMNNHAIYSGMYREVLLGIYSTLKYNQGGFLVYWSKDKGLTIQTDAQGQDVAQEVTRWQGNKMEALDMYNFLPDTTVHPTKLHCDGEYVGIAKARSYFWLQKKAMAGMFFNCDAALNQTNSEANEWIYYKNPPQEANLQADNSSGSSSSGQQNWRSFIMGGGQTTAAANFEVVDVYIWLNPVDFGLVPANQKDTRNRYEIWRVTLLNNKWIIDTTYMNNIHGYLPVFCGVINDDSMGVDQKSPAEIISPLQTFASGLLNTHVQGSRKELYGLTVYDPTVVDLSKIPAGEVAARIPIKPSAYGRDLRTALWSPDSNPGTRQTMEDLKGVMDIINSFFPTQSAPSQIANIDRAIDSQVAAVQQGTNRRQQKAARLLDETIFRPVRFAMYYNIIQFQPASEDEIVDYYTGETVQLDLQSLRNTNLPFIIGQGLKAIDRQAAAKSLQQVIFALIQAPQASQGIDILGLIDYWTSMIDVDIDMTTFRLQPQAPEGGQPEVDPATGQPIQRVVNPAGVTAPLAGGRQQ
jgi:hypothetical protein